jgi:hypothetical protein
MPSATHSRHVMSTTYQGVPVADSDDVLPPACSSDRRAPFETEDQAFYEAIAIDIYIHFIQKPPPHLLIHTIHAFYILFSYTSPCTSIDNTTMRNNHNNFNKVVRIVDGHIHMVQAIGCLAMGHGETRSEKRFKALTGGVGHTKIQMSVTHIGERGTYIECRKAVFVTDSTTRACIYILSLSCTPFNATYCCCHSPFLGRSTIGFRVHR